MAQQFTKYFDRDIACEVAQGLSNDDPEWAYRVIQVDDYWIIQVFDEASRLLGAL